MWEKVADGVGSPDLDPGIMNGDEICFFLSIDERRKARLAAFESSGMPGFNFCMATLARYAVCACYTS